MSWKLLGEILRDELDTPADKIERALAAQQSKSERLGKILCRDLALPELTLARALALQQNIPCLETIPADGDYEEVLADLPITYVRENLVFPLALTDDYLQLAVVDPLQHAVLNDLTAIYERPIRLSVTTATEIRQAINRQYEKHSEQAGEVMVDIGSPSDSDVSLEPDDLIDASDEAPIIRFVNSLLTQAYKQRASDIHIEPGETELYIR